VPIAWRRSLTPIVLAIPVVRRRWRCWLVIYPVAIAIIAIVVPPPAWVTPATAIPVIAPVIAIANMQRDAWNIDAYLNVGMSESR
jgi:ABC-type Na+ efflux pump permease subunit